MRGARWLTCVLVLAVAACEDPSETGPPAPAGQVSLAWQIVLDGVETNCEAVRGATVEVNPSDLRFDCEDGEGVINDLEPGVYEFTVYLLDPTDDVIDARNGGEGTYTLTEGEGLELGTVVFDLSSDDILVEQCDDVGDEDEDGDADCDDADCAEDPRCTGGEICEVEGDEDDDGDFDCVDEDCSDEPDCQEDCTNAFLTISEVYTHGGAGGAAYNIDFIVLKSRSQQPINLSSYSLQTSTILLSNWEVYPLPDEEIPANGTYLVTVGMAGSQGEAPPAADHATGTGDLSSALPFTVALMQSTDALTECPDDAVDLFSAGQDACGEGEAVPAPGTDTPTEWYTRAVDGCADTDDNATDITVGEAGTPRNSDSEPRDCPCPGPI